MPQEYVKGNSFFDYPEDRVVGYKEYITRYLNHWRFALIKRTYEFGESMRQLKADPSAMIPKGADRNAQRSISEICENKATSVREGRAYVELLEEMLAKAEEGDAAVVASYWNAESMEVPKIKINLSDLDEKKDEGKKE